MALATGFATGIHHLTSVTADVQANVDFYAGFLGLALVKQRGGFEDVEQLHLYYGDAEGRPGSLVSFHVWPGAGRGRTGTGQVSELAFSVPASDIGGWLSHALAERVPVEGPGPEFGAPVLRLKDPDGLIVKLVGGPGPESAGPLKVGRLHGVTLLLEAAEASAALLSHFGYAEAARDGSLTRLASQSDVIDLRAVTGYVPSVPGAGVPDHLALRVRDAEALEALSITVAASDPGAVADHTHFLSAFLTDPAGILLEAATDGPGMRADEPEGALGQRLFVPEYDPRRAADLRLRLPQFARPGEARFPKRDLPFIHRIHQPDDPDGSTLILLHDSDGSEADLLPFAHRTAPRATLIGLRGRATEERNNRWFRRQGFSSADQEDLRAEAEALGGFLEGASRGYGLDRQRLAVIGHGNGADLLAAAALLLPGVLRLGVVLRGGLALDSAPEVDLSGLDILQIDGAKDLFVTSSGALAEALEGAGASLSRESLPAGHGLTPQDETLTATWLATRL